MAHGWGEVFLSREEVRRSDAVSDPMKKARQRLVHASGPRQFL
jgi:hypothetical protein